MTGAPVYRVVHELPGRMRLRPLGFMNEAGAKAVGAGLVELPGVESVAVSGRTLSILVRYSGTWAKAEILAALRHAPLVQEGKSPGVVEHHPVPEESSGPSIPLMLATKFLLPKAIAPFYTLFRALPFVFKGIKALFTSGLSVEVLDAAAIGISLVRRDFASAASIAFLLGLGEQLERMMRRKARADLAETLAHKVDKTWVLVDGTEVLVPGESLKPGDKVVVRMGGRIPVDGAVVDGLGMVDESSFTGEPMPVKKRPGAKVSAGTVLAEGELVVLAEKVGDEARIAKLLEAVVESEKRKSQTQAKALRLADAVVPLTFGLSGAVFLATQNANKAVSVLLADYSCAVKLAVPLCILSAMREAAGFGAAVKGGKFLEALAKADVVVFDKTGTLTKAEPRVAEILAMPGFDEAYVLKTAACLEEHFPHPVARAVAAAAKERGLVHEEEHAKVEYILAHGIATTLFGERVIIGSRHFVFEDEKTPKPKSRKAITELEARGLTLLYLAVGGKLAGVVGVEDAVREDAKGCLAALKQRGLHRIVMLTGDSKRSAERAAAQLGIDEVKAETLPEDKAAFIDRLKAEGHTVIMVGDGVNDAQALSRADVGVSLSGGADLAKESCDILLTEGRLADLVLLRDLAGLAMSRVRSTYRGIIAVNTALIVAGTFGLVPPRLSAVLHNVYTLAAGVLSFRGYGLKPALHEAESCSPATSPDA